MEHTSNNFLIKLKLLHVYLNKDTTLILYISGHFYKLVHYTIAVGPSANEIKQLTDAPWYGRGAKHIKPPMC